jgi:hypothetical protein
MAQCLELRLCAGCSRPLQFGQGTDMTATAQQLHLFNVDAYPKMPPPKMPPPSFGLGRLLGAVVIILVWAPIALLIWMLT